MKTTPRGHSQIDRRSLVLGTLAGCATLTLGLLPGAPKSARESLAQRIRECLPDLAHLSDAEVLRNVRARVEADFNAGRIVRRDGWSIAETEAILFDRLHLY